MKAEEMRIKSEEERRGSEMVISLFYSSECVLAYKKKLNRTGRSS